MVATTVLLVVSMTDTELLELFGTYARRQVGLSATTSGTCPTPIGIPSTGLGAPSMTSTQFFVTSVMYTVPWHPFDGSGVPAGVGVEVGVAVTVGVGVGVGVGAGTHEQ